MTPSESSGGPGAFVRMWAGPTLAAIGVVGAVFAGFAWVVSYVVADDLAAFEQSIDRRFDAFEQSINRRFDAFEQSVSARFDDAGQRIDNVEQSLSQRIDRLDLRLDDVTERLARVEGILLRPAAAAAAASGSLAQPDRVAGFEVPRFEVDPDWPRLPDGWELGITSSVAVDRHDHVWILHRPRILHRRSAAPPVLEIDEDGNFVQGWGGLSDEYDWPHSEHGIAVDDSDNVWITGHNPYPGTGEDSSDDMLLKFTRTGEFLLQIGGRDTHRGNTVTDSLHTATDLAVHEGELYVSDGYGNRRVIVFDAETGAYRRMWGAFGAEPLDDPPAEDLERMAAGEPGAGPRQFSGVPHNIAVSNDGLVYVSDRGNRRIQVFRTDGTYVRQGFVNRDAEGLTTAGISFSADPEQRFLYTPDFHWGHVWVLDRKTLRVLHWFGEETAEPGDFREPHDIATDSRGNLYVAEVGVGARAQKLVYQGLK